MLYLHTYTVKALDKMESEWEPMLMEISAYKETGTFIMKSNEETGQMLDDHIVMTQAMSFSPYKKPFEGRITTWENKLRTTQVCIYHYEPNICEHEKSELWEIWGQTRLRRMLKNNNSIMLQNIMLVLLPRSADVLGNWNLGWSIYNEDIF